MLCVAIFNEIPTNSILQVQQLSQIVKKSNGEKSFFPLLTDMERDGDLRQEPELKCNTHPPLSVFPFCNTCRCKELCGFLLPLASSGGAADLCCRRHTVKSWCHWPWISHAKQSPLWMDTCVAKEQTEPLQTMYRKRLPMWWDVNAGTGSLVSSNSFGDSTSLSSLRPINTILLLEGDYTATDFLKTQASLYRRHCQKSSVTWILTHRISHTKGGL